MQWFPLYSFPSQKTLSLETAQYLPSVDQSALQPETKQMCHPGTHPAVVPCIQKPPNIASQLPRLHYTMKLHRGVLTRPDPTIVSCASKRCSVVQASLSILPLGNAQMGLPGPHPDSSHIPLKLR